ncbi:MAG: choice-of-anchor Q domain-containing protein [Chloroflexota bacterium]|jgi:hypothetical protein
MALGLVGLLHAAAPGSTSALLDAQPITVCPTGCDYDSLQPAVNAAADGAIITVGAGTYTGTTQISNSLTITGSGAVSTVLSGGRAGPVLVIELTVAVTVSNLAIRNGRALLENNRALGGGIVNRGILHLADVTLDSNGSQPEATADGPNIGGGGGIYNGCAAGMCGRLTMVNGALTNNFAVGSPISATETVSSTIVGGNAYGGAIFNGCDVAGCATVLLSGVELSGNTVRGASVDDPHSFIQPGTSFGGAIFNDCGPAACGRVDIVGGRLTDNGARGVTSCYPTDGFGGAIYNNGRLSLDRVSLFENSASAGHDNCFPYYYGASKGGAIHSSGRLTITASTLANNWTREAGGGIYILAGDAYLLNSTLSGNAAYNGAGGGIYNAGTLLADYVTIVDNVAGDGNIRTWGQGGGIYASGPNTRIANSILSGNTAPNYGVVDPISECYGPLTSLGYNLVSDLTRSPWYDEWECQLMGDMTGVITGTLAYLAPLADNGGPTLTHIAQFYSPALDAADPQNCPGTDQRGQPRLGPGAGRCDLGAVEGFIPPVSVTHLAVVARSGNVTELGGSHSPAKH